MNLSADELQTTQTITVKRKGDSVESNFSFTPVYQPVAKGMWSETMTPSLNGDRTVNNVLSGFKISPNKPVTPGHTKDIDTNKLEFDDLPQGSYGWESIESYDSIKPSCSEKELLEALGISY